MDILFPLATLNPRHVEQQDVSSSSLKLFKPSPSGALQSLIEEVKLPFHYQPTTSKHVISVLQLTCTARATAFFLLLVFCSQHSLLLHPVQRLSRLKLCMQCRMLPWSQRLCTPMAYSWAQTTSARLAKTFTMHIKHLHSTFISIR